MNAVSLFSGIGGIDLALERAGIPVVAAVEIDKDCRAKLAEHFPQTILFNDVTEVTGDDLLAAGFVPDGGLLAAGWPCQGNSVAGRRGGMADPRSGLWRHVVRLLAETRPTWFLGENVPGLLSVNGGADIAVVRDDLAQLGYWWAERILDAQHFGVPQRRRRVFFVGRTGDPIGPVAVLLEPEGSDRDPAAGGEARPGTAAASVVSTIQAGSSGRGHRIDAEGAAGGQLVAVGFAENQRGEVVTSAVSHQLTTGGGKPGQGYPAVAYALVGGGNDKHDESRMTYVTHALTSAGADASEDGTGRGPLLIVAAPLCPTCGCRVAFHDAGGFCAGPCGGQCTDLDLGRPVAGAFKDDDTTPTLPRSQTLAVSDPTAVRRLTPLECERLQGFPDGWTAGQSDSTRYRQLGNAVAVPCAEWITRRIAKEASAA